MATASRTNGTAKGTGAKKPRACRLLLEIDEPDGSTSVYRVTPIPSAWHSKAFRLRKLVDPVGEPVVYELGQHEFGPECNCPAAEFHDDRPCKHILALIACHVLDPIPTPARAAAPAPPPPRPATAPRPGPATEGGPVARPPTQPAPQRSAGDRIGHYPLERRRGMHDPIRSRALL